MLGQIKDVNLLFFPSIFFLYPFSSSPSFLAVCAMKEKSRFYNSENLDFSSLSLGFSFIIAYRFQSISFHEQFFFLHLPTVRIMLDKAVLRLYDARKSYFYARSWPMVGKESSIMKKLLNFVP